MRKLLRIAFPYGGVEYLTGVYKEEEFVKRGRLAEQTSQHGKLATILTPLGLDFITWSRKAEASDARDRN